MLGCRPFPRRTHHRSRSALNSSPGPGSHRPNHRNHSGRHATAGAGTEAPIRRPHNGHPGLESLRTGRPDDHHPRDQAHRAAPAPNAGPESRTAQIDNGTFKQRLADYRAAHPQSAVLSLGATVYRSQATPPRTLVQYWPERGGDPITFWSSADFSLIAGIHSFVATDGRTYSLFLAWGNIDTTRTAQAAQGTNLPPDIPIFPDGPNTFSIVGTAPADPSVLIPIQSLHDLYNKEFWRLKTAYDGRESARLQRAADLKANPPQPKNLVVNFWTADTPAPAKKGGAK